MPLSQQFKKFLQQDELSDRYFLQRIKSQSMGALSSMFAASTSGANRKHKSLSSNSLNSSQEQEPSPEAEAPLDPMQLLAVKRKGQHLGATVDATRRSVESLVR